MNRMELEQRSEECIDVDAGSTTVLMKNATSLGELAFDIALELYPSTIG